MWGTKLLKMNQKKFTAQTHYAGNGLQKLVQSHC